jgi:hypothetical protein
MPPIPGAAVLASLRATPDVAIAAWGFVVRGGMLADDAVGGACGLACNLFGQSGCYELRVGLGATDWYIPYGMGEARHCDVPRGQPNGTLVVTFPMNGCALEVRQIDGNTNRFYHDADGNSMPHNPPGALKIRVNPADYAGPERTAHVRALRYFAREVQDQLEVPNRGGYEHSIICVMRNGEWKVYGSTNMRLNGDAWQIKDRVPYSLGKFDD